MIARRKSAGQRIFAPRAKKIAATLVVAILLGGGLTAVSKLRAGEATKDRNGPLAGLPSPPGPHIEKIRELGDNSWLNLGPPKADPKWGKGRGRSWTAKMAFAPDLRGAFLYGEGVHGYVKPDGYYMDDLFFYDINAHRWVCLYPGLEVQTFDKRIEEKQLMLNDAGLLVDKDSRPLPVAPQGHGYQGSAYDTDLRRLALLDPGHGEWRSVKPIVRGFKLLEEQMARGRRRPHSPWFYNTLTGEWERHPVASARPTMGLGATLIYILSRKQFFFYYRSGEVWFYDPAARTWTEAGATGPRPSWGIDPTACYDTRRGRVYIGGGGYPVPSASEDALFIYDVKSNTWINPKAKGSRLRGFGNNPAAMHYDAVNDVVILAAHGRSYEDRRGIHVYDPEANTWLPGPNPIPAALTPGPYGVCVSAFYDPELNAHFYFSAGDSRTEPGSIWVYRYKRRPAK